MKFTIMASVIITGAVLPLVLVQGDTCNYNFDADYYVDSLELSLSVDCGWNQSMLYWSFGNLDESKISDLYIDYICTNDSKVWNLESRLFGPSPSEEDPMMAIHPNPIPTATGNSSNSDVECQYFGCYYVENVIYTFETVTCTFGEQITSKMATLTSNDPTNPTAVSSTNNTISVIQGTATLAVVGSDTQFIASSNIMSTLSTTYDNDRPPPSSVMTSSSLIDQVLLTTTPLLTSTEVGDVNVVTSTMATLTSNDPTNTTAVSSTNNTISIVQGTATLAAVDSDTQLIASPTIMSTHDNDRPPPISVMTSSSLIDQLLLTTTPLLTSTEVGDVNVETLTTVWIVAVGTVALVVMVVVVLLLFIGMRKHSSRIFHKTLKHPLKVIPHYNDDPIDVNYFPVLVEPQGLTLTQSDYSIDTHLDPFEYPLSVDVNNSPTNLTKQGALDSTEFLTSSYVQFHGLLYQKMSNFLQFNHPDSEEDMHVDTQQKLEESSKSSASLSNGDLEHTSFDNSRNIGHYHVSLDGSDYVELCPIRNSSQFVFSRAHQDSNCNSDTQREGPGASRNAISNGFTLSYPEITTLPDQAENTENGRLSRGAGSQQSNVYCMDMMLNDKDTVHLSHDLAQCTNNLTDRPDQDPTVECDLDNQASGTICEVKESTEIFDSMVYVDDSNHHDNHSIKSDGKPTYQLSNHSLLVSTDDD